MPSLSITGDERESSSRTGTAFLLYHGRSHVTGERLGDYLGIPHGRECTERYDYLIRWGNRGSVEYRPRETVLNSMRDLSENSSKLDQLDMLDAAGINVPEYVEDRDEITEAFGYPALGRSESHSRGEDINLILQWRDAYLTEGNDYFVEYVPTELEYRMHVIDGEVVCTHEKRLRSEADNHPFIRNSETGWVFLEPSDDPPSERLAVDAVGACGLDFGAVDIVRGEDGNEYVLEVNTAPSLDEANLERYGDAFAEYVGLNDWPGIDAVDFEEEEQEEQEEEEGLGELFG